MKTLNKFSYITLFVLMIIANTIQPAKAQNDYYSSTYQDFYNDLAPYGQWINDQQYGYIWLPDVSPDFRPYYTNGYWAMTEYGNTWVSGYDWGWAAFHYGRWTFDNYYGWLWIPGTEWAPAWVSWRSNNSYYGWAPMGPGINININIGNIPMDWWIFLSPNYFYQRSFQNNCYRDIRYTRNIYQQTNYINYVYTGGRVRCYTGPRANDYYRHTGQRASMYSIRNNNRRGATIASGNRLNIYRPNMQRNNNERPKQVAQTGRQLSPRLQNYGNGVTNNGARQKLLNQRGNQNAIENDQNKITREDINQQRNNDAQQQRTQQLREQQAQQRNNELQQQRTQQLRAQQAQQQRDQQIIRQREQRNNEAQQQRAQQIREQQAQQQRDQQIIQQREQRNNEAQHQRAQQLREQQAQQQRDQQIIQQREQRNNELQQQRAKQLRDQQKIQERNNEKQERMRSIERGGQNQERQNNNNDARPFGGRR